MAMKGFTGGYDSSDVLFGVDLSISAGEKVGGDLGLCFYCFSFG